MSGTEHYPATCPDLAERFVVLDLAQALADVDDPGCWWTLPGQGRDRYVTMAIVALELVGYEEEARVRARRAGFREAIELLESAAATYCLDCDADTIALGEFYMLRDPVWLEANPADDGMLCIDCVEKRLGRRLRPDDFNGARVNAHTRSRRLRSRILGTEETTAA